MPGFSSSDVPAYPLAGESRQYNLNKKFTTQNTLLPVQPFVRQGLSLFDIVSGKENGHAMIAGGALAS